MKICKINMSFSEEKAIIFSKVFANKTPLFDFINSFFDFITYGYQIIDGKITVEKSKNKLKGDCLTICYDYEDKVVLNLCGMYLIIISDITFEKICK